MKKPRIGITIGDPAGVGPEIVAKVLSQEDMRLQYDIVVYGYEYVLSHAFSTILDSKIPDDITIIEPAERLQVEIEHGSLRPEFGKMSMRFVETAIRDAMDNTIDAVVTAPIHKKAVKMAGYPFLGHTEFFGQLTDSTDFSMLLVGKRIRTVLVSTHLPLHDVPECITTERVQLAITNAHKAGVFFGIPRPKIAVCGLNPHAGDFGAIGDEEERIIVPAIQKAMADNINAFGPLPADSLYAQVAREGHYDFVVAMYHDQGVTPVKLEAFGQAVNVTLGLPIIRTSVDHGTAFDIAGAGVADAGSMRRAIEVAATMVENANTKPA